MTTISQKIPVTLTVEESERLLHLLGDYAQQQWNHARRTKSAAVRNICERDAAFARDLAAAIVRRLYQQTEVA